MVDRRLPTKHQSPDDTQLSCRTGRRDCLSIFWTSLPRRQWERTFSNHMSAAKKISLVVGGLALAGVVAVVLLMWRAPFVASAQPCVNNLRQLEGAKATWALENHRDQDTNYVPTWQEIQPYLGRTLVCPEGGTYTIGRVSERPRCSLAGRLINGHVHILPEE